MTSTLKTYTHEHGGRVVLLFLLFLLAIYNFVTSGFNSFAIVCVLPLVVLLVYVAFKWPYLMFWGLILVNYNIQFFNFNQWLPSGVPLSLYNELFEIVLVAIALIDFRKDYPWGRSMNLMGFAILLWFLLCA